MAAREMTVVDFHSYAALRRRDVEEAYESRLQELLSDVPAVDMASLAAALKAGKKIRGCLSCLTCECLGGTYEQAIPRAVAVEMIQAATLIHDDLVDGDAVRGGRAAVWTIAGPRRAVLIGDVIFAAAIKMMSDLGADDGRAVADAIAGISRGALKEPLDEERLAGRIESDGSIGRLYDGIVRLKTGLLFGAACTLGARAARAGAEVAERCRRYGLSIGEAYQIADDLKEVRECLSSGRIAPRRMAALSPALLRFIPSLRPFVLSVLRGDAHSVKRADKERLCEAAGLMEREIARRQEAAAGQIEGAFPSGGYGEAARRAPHDIIAIFNESP